MPRPSRPVTFAARVALAACAGASGCVLGPLASAPVPSFPTPAPAERLRGASLFGTDVIGLPTGVTMTPDAAPGSKLFALDPHLASLPALRAGNAVSMALSPDGRTLLVLTAGYNRTFDASGKEVRAGSTEWVFVYDVSAGEPRETGVVAVPDAFAGIVWSPSDGRFFVSGGGDDVVHEYVADAAGRFAEAGPAIALGHLDKTGGGGVGLYEGPYAAGLAMMPGGHRLVVANNENDSVSVVDTDTRTVTHEIALRPGGGVAGGEFPYGLVAVDDRHVFAASQRDREIVEVDIDAARVTRRIRVGSSPTTMTKNRRGSRVYVANANSDTVSVLDVSAGTVLASIGTSAVRGGDKVARGKLVGASPNWVALSPDESSLYVSDGGSNAIAIVALSRRDRGDASPDAKDGSVPSQVVGFVPTGFYPHAVLPSADGRFLYAAFGKSPTGPNPLGPWRDPVRSSVDIFAQSAANQYSLQLAHGGLHAFPLPNESTLRTLTAQTRVNNRMTDAPAAAPIFDALRRSVKHVIYIIAENRTYDQLFGDLRAADGDPRLVHWGAAITPNQHALATTFVTLDRFFDSGGVSGDGWQWTVTGRSTDMGEKVVPVEYANRGQHSYDWEGKSRNVNVAGKTPSDRADADPETPLSPDLLPGSADVGGVDEPDEGGTGRLWDAALQAGRSVRNYGCFIDDSRYGDRKTDPAYLPPIPYPFAQKLQVAYATRPSLIPVTDPYYRGFDMRLADLWREKEWERELDGYLAHGDLPALELIRLPHDHLGAFKSALDGVNTPDTQMADHDYALGLIVERLSKTRFWKDTVIIAIEDDAQNGADHVDAHRSLALFAGGHVRRGGAVVSSVYTTPSVLRTIELLLGLAPLGQNDAFAAPMGDVFQPGVDLTPFTAIVPAVLRSTELPLPGGGGAEVVLPRGDASSWALATAGYDFDHADNIPAADFNRLLYCRLAQAARCQPESRLPGHD